MTFRLSAPSELLHLVSVLRIDLIGKLYLMLGYIVHDLPYLDEKIYLVYNSR